MKLNASTHGAALRRARWRWNWRDKKVRVNKVAPGAIATPINEAWLHDPARRKQALALIPSRRIGQPEESGGAVLYLVSDDDAYGIGTTLFIDGGLGQA